MYNDIEQIINENLTLKKAYQLSKAHQDQIQKQLNQLRQKFELLNENFSKVSAHNDQLYQRNKRMQNQLANNNASFVSQIQELKSLIQQKQNELQNFQLKMIPSLDQDMIRVKLIAEMEGPYQQAVQKKQREISKLKDQLHQLRRQKQIIQFSLNNKQRDFKKQLEQTKQFYDNQIERLTRQLSHLNVKSSSGKIEKQLIRSYRTQIDQLKSACQFHKNTEEQLRDELIKLRLQRQKLLGQLAAAHSQKAIQIRGGNNNDALLKSLKDNIIRLEDELSKYQQQIERYKLKIKNLEADKKKGESNYQSELKDLKLAWEKQRDSMKNEISDYKQEVRKLRDYKNRHQNQYLAISEKYKLAISTQDRLNEQITNLKIRLNINDQYSTSRYKRTDDIDIEKTVREKIERQMKQKWQKQIKIQIQQEYKKGEESRRKGESPKRETDEFDQTKKNADKNKMKILQQKIKKLTMKLQFANRKILQLLRQKAHRSDSGTGNTDIGRSRSISYSPQHDYHHILLQHRDCSFVPMCPPVIMQHLEHIRPF